MAKVLLKNSFTATSVPAGLSAGELAVNVTDKKLFVGNAVGGVVTLVDPNALVTSVNGATGAITDVARTNQGNTFSVLQVMNAGITTANLYVTSGATFAPNLTVRLSTLASHPQVDFGGGNYMGGSIVAEAVNNVFFTAGQGGSGEYPLKPYMTFKNNSVNTEADINFSTVGGDIKMSANTDIDIVALEGNVNISSVGGGIVINPITFVNIAGGLLYVDDTNNRVGINDTTPSMALCVNGGISGNSIIIAAGATFNSTSAHTGLATFSGGLTASGATFSGNVNLQDNVLSRVEFLDYFERYVDLGDFTSKGNTIPIDLSTGQVFRVRLTVTGASGLTVSNVPDNGNANAVGFTLLFVGDGTARVMTWNIGGTAVTWAGGTAPTYTSTNNKTDVFSFLTRDGGTTWFGFVGGQNF